MIGLSVKTHYALLAVLDLAELAQSDPIQLRVIVDRYDLPHNYLEQAMIPLKQKGLVQSVRGSQGGYRLARPADQISVLEVVHAVEGDVSFIKTDNESLNCLDFFWETVDSELKKALSLTVYQLLQKKLADKAALTYII